jgi:prepilin-type N-terminal cleavage/methylation domain-containing protein
LGWSYKEDGDEMRSLSSKGFSLPEIMISLGLLGGISLVTMKLVEEQQKNQALIKARAEVGKVISLLKNTINEGENCRSMLAGRTLNSSGVSVPSLQIPLKGAPGSFKQILAASTTYPGFRTDTIVLIEPSGAAPGTAELRIRFKLKNREMKKWSWNLATTSPGDTFFQEEIPLLVSRNGANQITDCGSVVSAVNVTAREKFCRSLGTAAIWNSVTQTCAFNDLRCPYGTVLTRLTNMGTLQCDPIKNKIDLNVLFDTNYRCQNVNNNWSVVPVVPDPSQPTVYKLRIHCN